VETITPFAVSHQGREPTDIKMADNNVEQSVGPILVETLKDEIFEIPQKFIKRQGKSNSYTERLETTLASTHSMQEWKEITRFQNIIHIIDHQHHKTFNQTKKNNGRF